MSLHRTHPPPASARPAPSAPQRALQIAAPTAKVQDFEAQRKLRFEVELPERFRLMEVTAPLPNNDALVLVNAILFD